MMMKAEIRRTRGFTLIELLVVITIIAILASLSVPVFSKIQEQGQITKGINNCRQIHLALGLFATDNDGQYPSGNSANDAFRVLVQDQIVDKEDIFGCPNSAVGRPDGDLGEPPEYQNALERNENHWMMVDGLSSSAGGNFPILFECAVDRSNNPKWNPKLAGTSARGRTWSGGKIILATNDGSVSSKNKVASKESTSSLAPLGRSDKNIFERVQIPGILDVEGGGNQ